MSVERNQTEFSPIRFNETRSNCHSHGTYLRHVGIPMMNMTLGSAPRMWQFP